MTRAITKRDPRDIQIGGLVVTKTGIQRAGKFSEADWKNCAALLDQFNQGVNWCVGDLMLLGEPVFGEEKVHQWIDDMVPSMTEDQKIKCQHVANKFPQDRRNPSLSWSKHREAAWLEELSDRVELLERAVKEKLTEGDIRKAVRALKQLPTPELPAGKYHVIYADPPWRYDFSASDSRQIENQYPTMEVDEICQLGVSKLAADDCVLFLWATSPKLEEAFKVIEAWGFHYKTCMIWNKDKIGMGYYARQKHELLLICTTGTPSVPAEETRPASVIDAPRGDHSEKPDVFYSLIEQMYPTSRRVELFARSTRKGWKSWGNECGKAA